MKINWDKVDYPEPVLQRFPSRRSVVFGTKGVVAASQPLAVEAGLEILRKGGNAGQYARRALVYATYATSFVADAAVATSAALNVTEPCSCGIGGYAPACDTMVTHTHAGTAMLSVCSTTRRRKPSRRSTARDARQRSSRSTMSARKA